jgi:hypothetical protein
VRFHVRHRWTGWAADGSLRFATPPARSNARGRHHAGPRRQLGPARLGRRLGAAARRRGLAWRRCSPANCGFGRLAAPGAGGWSEHLRSRFAGQPLKSVAMRLDGEQRPRAPAKP